MEWDLFPFLFMVNKFKRMAAGVYSIHADYFMLYCYLFQTTLFPYFPILIQTNFLCQRRFHRITLFGKGRIYHREHMFYVVKEKIFSVFSGYLLSYYSIIFYC